MQEKSISCSSANALQNNEPQTLAGQISSIKRIIKQWAREIQGEEKIMTAIATTI